MKLLSIAANLLELFLPFAVYHPLYNWKLDRITATYVSHAEAPQVPKLTVSHKPSSIPHGQCFSDCGGTIDENDLFHRSYTAARFALAILAIPFLFLGLSGIILSVIHYFKNNRKISIQNGVSLIAIPSFAVLLAALLSFN